MAATGRRAVNGAHAARLLSEVCRCCCGTAAPCYHAAVQTTCRIREKLNANGDGIWIRCLGVSFSRQGRGITDRQCFLPPPPSPQTTPSRPPTIPPPSSTTHPQARKPDLSNCKLVTFQKCHFFSGSRRNIMTPFNVAMSGCCILDATHIKALQTDWHSLNATRMCVYARLCKRLPFSGWHSGSRSHWLALLDSWNY